MASQGFITVLVIVVVLFVVLLWNQSQSAQSQPQSAGQDSGTQESFARYPRIAACELNAACMWDASRQVTMNNGLEGVCTSHGIACPAFGKDHIRALDRGLSPVTISNIYRAIRQAEQAKKARGHGKMVPAGNVERFGRGVYSDVRCIDAETGEHMENCHCPSCGSGTAYSGP